MASLVLLDSIISEPGSYRTRSGEKVSVEIVSARHDFNCVGHYPNGVREQWHKSGRIFANRETQNDIVARE